MATLSQIRSSIWSLSATGGGGIAEGIAAIRQAIDIIIRTTKGTDPLRPLFGSNVYLYVDAPATNIPQIKAAILDAIQTWEPRVIITSLQHRLEVSHLFIDVGYRLTDSTIADLLTVTIGAGGVSTGVSPRRLILQGLIPENPSGFQYLVDLTLDGVPILPLVPESGFPSINEMYLWIKENWGNYGQWYQTVEKIIGYITPPYKGGSLSISLLEIMKFYGGIPGLPIEFKYLVTITIDGTEYESDVDLFNPEEIRQWAENTLGEFGSWKLENMPGSFNDDFNEDFELFRQTLALYTTEAENVIIAISTIEI
ncbi:GPW/gp25 family protein [Parasegetibacter sp. NRK P23]|uniref:GPW/gp25 family protein n=1 Tax=Parasegetibacter sp. NRK P23 TaxID=2942999 RepID=UPI002042ED19|nr:GPW/gp25 family protein [Parasegetibacter sp. NRK P23]MCM5528973.1 GPW/gp25 family protein [Parasegetibacter sp. NRK P23]